MNGNNVPVSAFDIEALFEWWRRGTKVPDWVSPVEALRGMTEVIWRMEQARRQQLHQHSVKTTFSEGVHLTAGRLRELLAPYPTDQRVLVHAGWDFPVLDDGDNPAFADEEDGEDLVLYVDYEDDARMVSIQWLNEVSDEQAKVEVLIQAVKEALVAYQIFVNEPLMDKVRQAVSELLR